MGLNATGVSTAKAPAAVQVCELLGGAVIKAMACILPVHGVELYG